MCLAQGPQRSDAGEALRVLGFASTKVKLKSLFTSRFIVTSIHGIEYFVLVLFDGINLSRAPTKPILNLTHMSLTDM